MPAGTGQHLTPSQRLDWLRLIRSENVGPVTFRQLLNRFGSAQAALEALPSLVRNAGLGTRITPRGEAEDEMEATEQRGARFVGSGEPDYPPLLRYISAPPPLVVIAGGEGLDWSHTVGVVGARNASAAGQKMTRMLATDLGESGYTVVSGLARGIDAAAHRASLASGTVAVLAGGHNHIYPAEHEGLAADIVANGVVLSEMPIDWEPRARDFPRRNRLISGLAAGVVVVEAAKRSGTLITARMAGEQGREVFAVPGSPLDPRAEGTNGLLKQGATLVTEAADVITALEPILDRPIETPAQEPDQMPQPGAEPGEDERTRIVSLLGPTPVTIDDLVRLSKCSPAIVRTVLLELEIAGRLERHGGSLVSLL